LMREQDPFPCLEWEWWDLPGVHLRCHICDHRRATQSGLGSTATNQGDRGLSPGGASRCGCARTDSGVGCMNQRRCLPQPSPVNHAQTSWPQQFPSLLDPAPWPKAIQMIPSERFLSSPKPYAGGKYIGEARGLCLQTYI
jgi:hypothetical protein